MAVTTDSAEPAANNATAEVKQQPDTPVESTAEISSISPLSSITADNSGAFRDGLKNMLAAQTVNLDGILPRFDHVPRGDRYAQLAGDTRTDATTGSDTPAAEISDEKRQELKDKYKVDVELKDGKYRFTREIDGKPREVFSSDATPEGMDKAFKALEKQEEFFKKYGVETYIEDGKFKFTHELDGEIRDAIPPIDATPDAMDKAEQNLQNQTQAKIKELEKRFRISISPPGIDLGNQENLCKPKGDATEMPKVKTRTPTLGELAALEQALSQSEPSQLTLPGEKPLSVIFTDQSAAVDKDGKDVVRGFYVTPEMNRGQGVLVITPSGADAPLTDKDAKGDEESLASTIRHELAHNGQRNVFRNMEIPPSLLNKMGWVRFPNPEYNANQPGSSKFSYAVKTEDGKYFTNSGPGCDSSEGVWRRVDKDGKYLDANGKPVQRKEDADVIDNDKLSYEALVIPSTGYFTSPLEVLAEGMKAYRGGEESQENLKKENPELFKIIAEVDELERKYRYGVDRNGKAKVQRRPDGTLDR